MNDGPNRADSLRKRIPLLERCSKLEKIHKGYSSDEKYIGYDSDGTPLYVVRTFGIERETEKRSEFRCLEIMEQQDVKCSRAVEMGVLPELKLGYMIVSFVEGNEASEELPLLPTEAQYRIGVEAGRELRKIHQVRGPEQGRPWHERMAEKHRRYRTSYAQCGVKIRNEEELLSFIDRHLSLMQDRPSLFQHDDYHVGNLILNDSKLSGVIDFNRSDCGDPIHEFVKVGIFSAEVSVPFSVGQIDGYYDGKQPEGDFWPLYSLYLAMTLISSVVWILKVRPEELELMMQKIDKVMEDHENFELIVPKWYSRSQHRPR